LKAVLLAAGGGTRMWPLAINRPKHILPIAGKPIISYLLQALAANSIRDVYVVVGFKGELVKSALGDGSSYGVNLEYLKQRRWTGTASALRVAKDVLRDEKFLALYGDLWVNPSALQAVIEKSDECSKVVGVVRVPNPSEFGVVELHGDKLSKITEKPKLAKSEGWINSGVYAFDQEVLKALETTKPSKSAEYELTTSLQHLLDDRGDRRRGGGVS
jgi:bifunctional UDP-N-acetylglucosamine pyrophosphorylase/glucosamine-1-phosphate N-acetyltransferase